MKAIIYEVFNALPQLRNVPDPAPERHGVVIKVMATGVCRSDWHGWVGHDADIQPPHVPGHELAGVVAAVGKEVTKWNIGDRVTVPFVGGCGACSQCTSGNQQVCDHQFQPGFTHWGSFAEYVSIHQADTNLVRLPDSLNFPAAASLGCRFVTSFRAVVDQGKTSAGQWVAVHGCGGVGLSAVMVAKAIGANVVAIDISEDALAEQSMPAIPMSKVIAHELEILGSHGMQAHRYDALFAMIEGANLPLEKLIGKTITLEQSIDALVNMDQFQSVGLTVVTEF